MAGPLGNVLVAMSGGVDSSVTAALLAEAGYDVVGVTLKLWGGESDSGCCSVSDVDDARWVAHRIGIDHHVFNFGDDFDRYVVEPYVAAHSAGETPNPCVECNRHIKFDKLFRRADALGFDAIATGHHARVVTDGDAVRRIARGADGDKDQSYVLHMLGQAQLARLLLPVGHLTKGEVRAKAADLGLPTADKPDSQDVCFIHSQGGRQAFLGDRIPLATARLVDTDGRDVGAVDSVELVTIGQRRGLDLGGDTGRRYVIDIDRPARVVTVGRRDDLLVSWQRIDGLAWSHQPVDGPLAFQCSAHGTPRPGRLDGGAIIWDRPQPRVATGQSIAVYVGDRVVGGGVAGAAPNGFDPGTSGGGAGPAESPVRAPEPGSR
ncbi:MAG: tRNA 2-thiouridine(34) synthase MnmA [Acidimicrobiia bacterium]|nr:tRNA 2-thiouridine(34) synthase MnmA [Acidimicrobiia bacterium]